MKCVTILGGTGIFGSRIARALADTNALTVRITGRDDRRGRILAQEIGVEFAHTAIEDSGSLDSALDSCALLVHAAGPFQGQDYRVARACIDRGVQYLDLADAREFVTGITSLDAAARERGVFVGSGASSVPTITHALVKELTTEFAKIDTLDIALSPGNQNPRGAATIGAILGSLGSPMRIWIDGAWRTRRGWGDATTLDFPERVGRRTVYNCAVPDLDLFPAEFQAQTVRFRAGLELRSLNRILSLLAASRRWRLIPSLEPLAPLALRASLMMFDRGSKNGALAVWAKGFDHHGKRVERKIALVTSDDGPATPSAPGILLARKLLLGDGIPPGARPCMGMLTLREIRSHLAPLGVWCASSNSEGQWTELLPSVG